MAESGFLIDGNRYEVPPMDTLDLDEEQILFDLAGVVQTDFVPAHPDADPEVRKAVDRALYLRIRNPAFKRALAHIAYRRAHPDADFDKVQLVVGKLNAADAEVAILRGEHDPPATSSQSEPENNGTSSEPSSSTDSGSSTENESAQVVALPASTGTGR